MQNDIGQPLTTGTANLSEGAPRVPASVQNAAEEAAASATQQAATQAARQAATRAGSYARQGANEIRLYIETNHVTLHTLSFIGGLALVVTAALSLFNVFGVLVGPFAYIKNFYRVGFGITICIIDGPSSKLQSLQDKILHQHASFLANNTNRALFYLYMACIEGTENDWVRMIIGWYFVAISVAHFLVKFYPSSRLARELDAESTVDPSAPADAECGASMQATN